jgi:hypothetical protein
VVRNKCGGDLCLEEMEQVPRAGGRAQAEAGDVVVAGARCRAREPGQVLVGAVFAPVAAHRFLTRWGHLATA